MSDHFGKIVIQPDSPVSPPQKSKNQRKKPTTPRQNSKKGSGSKKNVSLLSSLLLVLLFTSYTAIGFWAIPYCLKVIFPSHLKEHYGITVNIGSVTFNPFSFELSVEDLQIYSNENKTDSLLSLSSFTTDIVVTKLLKGKFIASHLRAELFKLNIERESEGNYNYPFNRPTGEQYSLINNLNFTSFPFHFSINNISLTKGHVTFIDKPNNARHVIEDISLTLPHLANFSSHATSTIQPSFSAMVNGSPIQLTGQATLVDSEKVTGSQYRTELSCSFNTIDLKTYFDYLPSNLPFGVSHGKATGSVKIHLYQPDIASPLSLDFSLQTSDLLLYSEKQHAHFHVPSATIEGSFLPLATVVHFSRIDLLSPTINISDEFSFADYTSFISFGNKKNSESKNRNPAHTLSVKQLTVKNGTLSFTGETETTERDRWHSILVDLKNYSTTQPGKSENQTAEFSISAKQTGTNALLHFNGDLDLNLMPRGNLSLRNLAASSVFNGLGLDSLQVKNGLGSANMYVSFSDDRTSTPADRLRLTNGSLDITDIILTEQERNWYLSPAIKITGISKEKNKVSLGNLHLKDSTLNLLTDSLPEFIQLISRKKTPVSVGAIDFSGSIHLSKKSATSPELHFSDVSLQAIKLQQSNQTTNRDNLSLTAQLGVAGQIQAKGRVQLVPFTATFTTGFSGIDSTGVLPWLGNSDFVKDVKTNLAGKGQFNFPNISYHGYLRSDEGRLKGEGKTGFSWDTFELKEVRFNSSPLYIGATQCNIVAPITRWTYTPNGLHIAHALSKAMSHYFSQSKDASRDYAALPLLEIENTHLSNGSITITDSRLSPNWTNPITRFSGTIGPISSSPPKIISPFSFTGLLASTPFTFSGETTLFDPSGSGNAEFTLNNLPFTTLHPSIPEELQLKNDSGKISVDLSRSWTNNNLYQTGSLTINDAQSLEPNSDTELTLALVNDSANSFSLSFEEETTEHKAPQPLYRQGVEAFNKIRIKAAISPLLLVDGDFSDLIGNEFTEFQPGQFMLTDTGKATLIRFSNLLSAHLKIGITVTGSADVIVDGDAMKSELEQAELLRVEAENLKRSAEMEQATAEYLRQVSEAQQESDNSSRIIEQDIPTEIYNLYTPLQPQPVIIDRAMLKSLAAERERVIVNFLIENLGISPERISLGKETIIHEDKTIPGNRVIFTLGATKTIKE